MYQLKGLWRYRFTRVFGMATFLAMLLSLVGLPLSHPGIAAYAAAPSGCQLHSAKGNIQHVIYIQFDNTHFTRDNPNVPSDLEQMPNLLNFMESNGVLLTNHHTPLISHTANDILTSLTGVYGDRHGVPVANSFRYFNPNDTSNLGVSFAYWTDPLFDPTTSTPTDTTFNMLTAQSMNAPAPWVPFTSAGCNFGSVATANTILENTAVDVAKVFGPGTPQAIEASTNPPKAQADFVGIGIHCALNNTLCSTANTGQPDLLPQEPGGYTGYMGLFGHEYVAPQISPNGPLTDLNNNVIKDPNGNVGFPGFDGMSAAVSLSYVAAMQEHGVPITYAYISDAHDKHPSGPAYGPGQAGYVAALQSYNDAFGKFFTQLANNGINKSNTLFVFTSDEGDHFVGVTATGCDGVTTPCTYGPNQIGEVNANMAGLLATEQGITTPFKVHSDSAPTIYITGNPARDAAVTRAFDRALGKLTAVNPYTGNTDTLTKFLADSVEMKLLHMVTADPARTSTLTMFADPNYFLFAGGTSCSSTSPCVTINPGFAWNHGDVQPEIVTTWLGMVGPGVDQTGIDSTTWSDHTDIRPTIMTLLGLKDDYSHDGRTLVEDLTGYAQPSAVKKSSSFVALAQIYKQLDACVGQFGLATLGISNRALESNTTGDNTYTNLESALSKFGTQRDALASQMISLLEGAEFNGQPFSDSQAQSLISQGQALLNQVNNL
jgi:arylsulfatase A-like enzyme